MSSTCNYLASLSVGAAIARRCRFALEGQCSRGEIIVMPTVMLEGFALFSEAIPMSLSPRSASGARDDVRPTWQLLGVEWSACCPMASVSTPHGRRLKERSAHLFSRDP